MVWIIAAMLLGVAELVTGGTLVLAMLSGGALAGAATSALTDNVFLPWAVFAVVSVGLLVGLRPIAHRHLRQPLELASGTARLVGRPAEVTSEVTGRDGRVKLAGEVWSARAMDGQSTYPPGATVLVLEIDGATALVG